MQYSSVLGGDVRGVSEKGSPHRFKGKEARPRDVQLLFADLATGANSTAIVSQGRVGALIGAKPTDRRTLLEEAAGIRGLHSSCLLDESPSPRDS